ncbi:MAG: hypothetical protein A2836_00115 [Candidatus Taylorbacteria bacterium RIFCSPHIGHO2_01_FULL_45_63]|uniref:Uncharacterized protein n=1 Tax=Candidatus Taylorbacteria bacterium RIFCSPHIGHO2_02_FULL_45_35 TaxID=1802311 RepID=A0A1G2MTK9_9BACT|nr:MAG: hypothetical protein A2836_00115 [Candidatus Taylorbacteria bacterium RIFCSPHIGHO2_01_FULL_45_63]OHA27196.1 MAG: hypothetical protein A3D56_01940 [Candidatus Taylorbacteria bacterium RIFCSPHIGHO2_02_FULL_45_35]OHA33690.1 MAG: hypothetical protein A3A22_03875 [Candidatus Taylorbacteria bacterium RIFCSPLOWO2_01_FULL_45_34b]
MNKTVIAYLVVLVVIILAIFGWNIMKGGNDSLENEATSATSLKDLVNSGKPQTCTFTEKSGTSENSGVVYVDDGKIRSDFNVTTTDVPGGQSFESHMISDGKDSYVWTSLTTQGFKSPIAGVETSSGSGASSRSQAVDYNQALDYKCQNWTPDQSKFELPAGITFVDLNTLIQGSIPKTTGGY